MLERISQANDIKKIEMQDLPALADEIRAYMIDTVSRTGGHLASNLGAVELTMALHRTFTLPRDRIIWDVGHQCYTHKILTGRKEQMQTLRQEGGLSGFPRREESDCDAFDAGHSSNSISAGLGYVRARDLERKKYSVVSVIGDGAMTGGLAFEALNNAAELNTNYIIVLNDNHMSISENVGGLSRYLGRLRTSPAYTGLKGSVQRTLEKIPAVGDQLVEKIRRTKSSIKQLVIPGMFFEEMGITYLGPVDGHNIRALTRILREARQVQGAVLVHVLTEKGRGYLPAMQEPERFHGIGPFDAETGKSLGERKQSYTDVFGEEMLALANEESRLVAITAAMREGTGLHAFSGKYPDRFFDVGIAEGHAVTFAAGFALGGQIPVFAVYSSFLQRGFDQIMEDVCMQDLHVIFAVDRAGFVGADGKTHNGTFDVSYLSLMPGMTVMAPGDAGELRDMLRFAVSASGPVALRYPRDEAWLRDKDEREPIRLGKAEVIREGNTIALLSFGAVLRNVCEAAELLREKGYDPTVVNMRFARPIDSDLLRTLAQTHTVFMTIEENSVRGGFGEAVKRESEQMKLPVKVFHAAAQDAFTTHACRATQLAWAQLDAASLAQSAAAYYEGL